MFQKLMEADGYLLDDSAATGCEVAVMLISFKGVTAGDRIALRDTGPTGAVVFEFTCPAANGFERVPFRADMRDLKLAGRGYYTEVKSGGTIRTLIRG